MQQSHGGFLRRCRLAGGFLHQSHGGFLHQFPRPDKATLKQQKLQLENFVFSVFPHILVCFLRDVSVTGASPPDASGVFAFVVSFRNVLGNNLVSTSRQGNF